MQLILSDSSPFAMLFFRGEGRYFYLWLVVSTCRYSWGPWFQRYWTCTKWWKAVRMQELNIVSKHSILHIMCIHIWYYMIYVCIYIYILFMYLFNYSISYLFFFYSCTYLSIYLSIYSLYGHIKFKWHIVTPVENVYNDHPSGRGSPDGRRTFSLPEA